VGLKAGRRLNEEAKARRVERRNVIGWRYVPAVLAYCAVCSMFIVYAAWVSSAEVAWFVAGFAGGVSMLFLWVAADSVSASRLETAAYAEDGTSREVRKLRDKGWTIVDNIPFDKFDVDHVAIGPGGVIVLETKWTADGFFRTDGRLNGYGARAIEQVNQYVPSIDAVLRQYGYLGGVTAAAVVVWGAGVPAGQFESKRPNGILVDGMQLRNHLCAFDPRLSRDEIEAAREALERFVDVRLERITRDRMTSARADTGRAK
jgi:hypothetical protein